MKKFLGVILAVVMALFGLTACGTNNGNNNANKTPDADNTEIAGKILIAYFSCMNTTETIAKHIETATKGTVYEIIPEAPYTAEDLQYYTGGRADREQADATARPAISGNVENIDKYSVIFLGYPIWHGQAPKIIYTSLESYDFFGKKIIPFCTSHSSGIGSSDINLHALAPSAAWVAGRRFAAETPQSTVAEWIKGLGIMPAPDIADFDLKSGETVTRPKLR